MNEGKTADILVPSIVKEIGEKEVIIDFNHPLAGKDLEYKIKIDSLL